MLIVSPEDWSNVIRDRRVELGMSQAALAAEIGMSRQWVVRFEGGHSGTATLDHLARLARAVELDVMVFDG